MYCPFCGSDQIIVINSRPTNKNTQIWRRRKCLKCQELFTTRELIDISYIIVEKRNGTRVQFSRPKLYSGIYQALVGRKKIDRGDAGEIAEDIMHKIEEQLVNKKIKVIKTEEIGFMVVKILSKTYPDIALRYFAYFDRNPKISDYIRKIKQIIKE
jgi:transcriptional repressor NrdR